MSAVIGCVVVLVCAQTAPSEVVPDEVQTLSDQANAAYQTADYPKSLDLLRRAYALRPLPRLLFNMARTLEKLRQWSTEDAPTASALRPSGRGAHLDQPGHKPRAA